MTTLAYRVAELERRLNQMLRIGIVAEADYDAARVRVESGGLLTDWLPWLTQRAMADRSWWAPGVGEQVLVISPCGDIGQGVVLPAIYQDAASAPAADPHVHRHVYADGAEIEYDSGASVLRATLPGSAHVVATDEVTVTAESITATATTIVATADEITAHAASKLTATGGTEIVLQAPAIKINGALTAAAHDGVSTGETIERANRTTIGNVRIEGALHVTGNITSDGQILDTTGNSNHHVHDQEPI